MKITFVAPRYHTNQHFWMKSLLKDGHQVSFIVDRKASDAEHYEMLEPTVAEIQSLPKFVCFLIDMLMRMQGKQVRARLHTLPKWSFLKTHLVEDTPDVVIVRDTGSMLSVVTFIMCRLHKIPCILYNQHPLEDREHRLTRWLQAIGVAPKVRITPMRKNVSHTHNAKQNSFYVPLISEFTYDASSRPAPAPPIKLLFIGKFTMERKKHMLLLESVRSLSHKYSVELTMVGAYHESNIKPYQDAVAFVHDHKLQDKVTLLQNVPYTEMPALYQAHDLFVLPSVDEPFAISPLEAMNFGLPVIITDSNGARGCVRDGVTGFVVPSDDQDALTEKISLLLADTALLQTMGSNAHKHVLEQHNNESFLLHLYRALNAADVQIPASTSVLK